MSADPLSFIKSTSAKLFQDEWSNYLVNTKLAAPPSNKRLEHGFVSLEQGFMLGTPAVVLVQRV